MEKSRTERLNELYAKQKAGTLTADEKKEQATLRQEYLAAFRNNFRGILDNTYLKRPDGTKEPLGKKEN